MKLIQLESPQYYLPKLRYDFYKFNDHGFMVYEG